MEQVGHYNTAPHYAFLFLPLYRGNTYEYLTKIHCLNINKWSSADSCVSQRIPIL